MDHEACHKENFFEEMGITEAMTAIMTRIPHWHECDEELERSRDTIGLVFDYFLTFHTHAR